MVAIRNSSKFQNGGFSVLTVFLKYSFAVALFCLGALMLHFSRWDEMWESGVSSIRGGGGGISVKGEGGERAVGVVSHLLKQSPAGAWKMWDQSSVLTFQDQSCNWQTFKPDLSSAQSDPAMKEAKMCVHDPFSDKLVSASIVSRGRWNDCNKLTSLWLESTKHGNGVYVEIGGNIGSCVMQMLLSTNASIIAFEPHPKNLHCLTSTLMELDPAQRSRVSLFPIALGATSGNSTIIAAKNNMGNSIVGGKEIKDAPSQTFYDPIPIPIEPLDSILFPEAAGGDESMTVSLMKIDAQGLECQIMDGMPRTLMHTRLITGEVAGKWLRGQGCKVSEYLNKLSDAGFDKMGGSGWDHAFRNRNLMKI